MALEGSFVLCWTVGEDSLSSSLGSSGIQKGMFRAFRSVVALRRSCSIVCFRLQFWIVVSGSSLFIKRSRRVPCD